MWTNTCSTSSCSDEHMEIISNTPRSLDISVSNMCSPIKPKPELQDLDCWDKRETTTVQENRLGVYQIGKYGYHCKKDTEMGVRNEDFTSLQTYNGSSDVGILTAKQHTKIADNMELDTYCLGNKDIKMIVKCS